MAQTQAILFAGGGTGGHIFPSLAVVEQLAEQAGDAMPDVHFACSQRPLDADLLREHGQSFTPLPVVGLPGARAWELPGFGWRLWQSVGIVHRLIAERRIDTVVAMGGYVSGPVVIAAQRAGVRRMLVNLDAVAGKANRRLASRCDLVCTVHDTPGLGRHVRRIGFPLRKAALADEPPAEARKALQLEPDRPTLLVTGASQGAQSLNRAMIELARRGKLAAWQVLHLAGKGNTAAAAEAYEAAGVAGRVLPSVQQMGRAWAAADLAISRAGAGSAAEVRANAVPTIFLPYPYHKDEHQKRNVVPLHDAGAAVVLHDEIDPTTNADQLGLLLDDFATNPGRLTEMRQRFAALFAPNGAAELAAILLHG